MTQPLLVRAGDIHDFYVRILGDPIPRIFVSEYVAEGKRQYESLWFFTPRLAMEAKSWLTQDSFDFANIARKLVRIEVQKTDYDFRRATEASRLSIDCVDDQDVYYALKGSGANCDRLREIFSRFLFRNLRA